MPIKISKKNLEQIHAHARKTFPEECCGLLAGEVKGNDKLVKEVFEAENIAPNKKVTYKISPEDFLSALKKAGDKFSVIGCYHSHPRYLPRPSFVDVSSAIPDFLYLIVSLDEKKVLDTRAWIYDDCDKRFVEENIE